MNSIVKTLRYNELFLLYQSLLSETQKEILKSYFIYDLSISEIAESRNISRAAVEDAIKKGTHRLDEFERSLKLLEKQQNILKKTAILKDLSKDSNEIYKLVVDIEKEIY